MICRLNGDQISEYRELWKEVFHDDEAFLSFFFSRKAWFAMGVAEEGKLLSALTYVPYGIRLGTRIVRSAYLVGLVTRTEARGKGHAYRLMQEGEKELAKEGIGAYLLYPAIPYSFYTKRGGLILDERIAYTLDRDMPFAVPGTGKPVRETTDLERVSRIFDRYNARFSYATHRELPDWENRMEDLKMDGGRIFLCGDAAALACGESVYEVYGLQEDVACLCNALLEETGKLRFTYARTDPLYRYLPEDARGHLMLEPHAVLTPVPGTWEKVFSESERDLLTRTDEGKPDGRIYDDY